MEATMQITHISQNLVPVALAATPKEISPWKETAKKICSIFAIILSGAGTVVSFFINPLIGLIALLASSGVTALALRALRKQPAPPAQQGSAPTPPKPAAVSQPSGNVAVPAPGGVPTININRLLRTGNEGDTSPSGSPITFPPSSTSSAASSVAKGSPRKAADLAAALGASPTIAGVRKKGGRPTAEILAKHRETIARGMGDSTSSSPAASPPHSPPQKPVGASSPRKKITKPFFITANNFKFITDSTLSTACAITFKSKCDAAIARNSNATAIPLDLTWWRENETAQPEAATIFHFLNNDPTRPNEIVENGHWEKLKTEMQKALNELAASKYPANTFKIVGMGTTLSIQIVPVTILTKIERKAADSRAMQQLLETCKPYEAPCAYTDEELEHLLGAQQEDNNGIVGMLPNEVPFFACSVAVGQHKNEKATGPVSYHVVALVFREKTKAEFKTTKTEVATAASAQALSLFKGNKIRTDRDAEGIYYIVERVKKSK
jgi:hypothetical protein